MWKELVETWFPKDDDASKGHNGPLPDAAAQPLATVATSERPPYNPDEVDINTLFVKLPHNPIDAMTCDEIARRFALGGWNRAAALLLTLPGLEFVPDFTTNARGDKVAGIWLRSPYHVYNTDDDALRPTG